MIKYKIRLLGFLIFISFLGQAQTKNEQETRIEPEFFPDNALQLLQYLPKDVEKLKYYKEVDDKKTSYEAKLIFQNKKYSIEFDEKGILEDIEITLKFKELNKEVMTAIKNYFKDNYKRHYFLKIQKQYENDTSKKAELLLEKALKNSIYNQTNFEIIAQVKDNESKKSVREFLFNSKGKLIDSRLLESSSYEHVLY